MTVKKVADMLALAYEGYEKARETNNSELKMLSQKLVAKALAHESACEFFSGIQLALGEFEEMPFGNDPDIDNNDEGILDPQEDDTKENPDENPDEDTPAASPAYEGVTDDEDSHQDEENKPEEGKLIAIVASNFMRLRNGKWNS